MKIKIFEYLTPLFLNVYNIILVGDNILILLS